MRPVGASVGCIHLFRAWGDRAKVFWAEERQDNTTINPKRGRRPTNLHGGDGGGDDDNIGVRRWRGQWMEVEIRAGGKQ